MSVAKILLFYRFVPLADPEAVRLWQLELCTRLGLRGRIIVAPHGINGTLGGELDACKAYLRATKQFAPFHDLDPKWSAGSGLDASGLSLDFPRLSVKTRPELVAFGASPEVDENGVIGGGQHLSPDEVDALAAARDVVFFDGRNQVEAAIGRFDGAVVPDVDNTHDFVAELESGKYDHLKGRPVVTYCTGGVRCEVLSALMIEHGFGEVYQIDGGIARYLERFGSSSRWKGDLAVFDGREVQQVPGSTPIGACHRCNGPTSRLQNCDDPACKCVWSPASAAVTDQSPAPPIAHRQPKRRRTNNRVRMSVLFDRYPRGQAAYDEVVGPDGIRAAQRSVVEGLDSLGIEELRARSEYLRSTYIDQGVTFDIGGEERPFRSTSCPASYPGHGSPTSACMTRNCGCDANRIVERKPLDAAVVSA